MSSTSCDHFTWGTWMLLLSKCHVMHHNSFFSMYGRAFHLGVFYKYILKLQLDHFQGWWKHSQSFILWEVKRNLKISLFPFFFSLFLLFLVEATWNKLRPLFRLWPLLLNATVFYHAFNSAALLSHDRAGGGPFSFTPLLSFLCHMGQIKGAAGLNHHAVTNTGCASVGGVSPDWETFWSPARLCSGTPSLILWMFNLWEQHGSEEHLFCDFPHSSLIFTSCVMKLIRAKPEAQPSHCIDLLVAPLLRKKKNHIKNNP